MYNIKSFYFIPWMVVTRQKVWENGYCIDIKKHWFILTVCCIILFFDFMANTIRENRIIISRYLLWQRTDNEYYLDLSDKY